ncbi:MAG: transporter substrate-binding domain-containing protein [Firmicutes bacterium]|nr:transporter substrate-binding domain-containing protein [Bacillota bacterium]
MEIIKKMNALFLVAALVLACMVGFMACSDNAGDDGAAGDTGKPTLTVALSPDFSPMEFVDTSKTGQDQYVGFDITLANFIADELGMELVIKPMSFDACQAAVQSGNVDISISGYSYTPERAENFNLSDYYYAGENETEQVIIVLADKAGRFSKADDFAGLTVGAQTASLQMTLCESQLPETAKIKEFGDIGTAVEALRNGNIDALAVAQGNGEAIIANNDNIGFSGFEFTIAVEAENNVILIQKGNDELTEKINACLKKAYDNNYYGQWYADAQALAGIDTAADVSYDAEGNAE